MSAASCFGRLRGRPGFPVRTLSESSMGRTWARSLSRALVTQTANGIPLASTREWMSTPLPLNPYSTPSPPPLPGGKGAVDTRRAPVNHAFEFGHDENSLLKALPGAVVLPGGEPAMRGRTWSKRRLTRQIAPTGAGVEDVEDRIDDTPWRGRRLPSFSPDRLLRKIWSHHFPLLIAHTFKSTRH